MPCNINLLTRTEKQFMSGEFKSKSLQNRAVCQKREQLDIQGERYFAKSKKIQR